MTMIEGGRRRRRRRRRGRGRWWGIGWGRRGRWGWGTVVTAVTTTKSWRISTARVNQRRRSHFASVTTLAIYRRLKGGATGKTPKEKEKKGNPISSGILIPRLNQGEVSIDAITIHKDGKGPCRAGNHNSYNSFICTDGKGEMMRCNVFFGWAKGKVR